MTISKNGRHQRWRKAAALVSAGAALASALVACGGGGGSTSGNGDIELRFAWWGGETRHALTQQVIERYEAANPGINIQPEYSDWAGYWDRLATTVAARDAPDIMQMDLSYLSEYMGRGALLELPDSVNTSEIDAAALESGQTEEGLFGVPSGINTYSVIANPAIFKAAGVEMPDDSSWTWDDFEAIAKKITTSSKDGVSGASLGFPTSLDVVARQNGQSMFTKDGRVGISQDLLTEYWETVLRRSKEGVIPPASVVTENMNVGVEQTHFAKGQSAMTFDWSNQLKATMDAMGSQDLKLLRLPSQTGKAEDAGASYKASQLWTVSSQSKHPEQAAKFVGYLINSPEAAGILLAERGAPPNGEMRKEIADKVSTADGRSMEFIGAIADEVKATEPPLPVGGGSVGELYYRYATEVLFERQTPGEAAERFISELQANLQK